LLPVATAQVQIRRAVEAGDVLYNKEIIIFPLKRTLFHQDTLATTDTEALAISPISSGSSTGFTLAQTSDETAVATSTGFITVNFPFIRIEDYPGEPIGGGLNWAASAGPITFAGMAKDMTMTFPSMNKIIRTGSQAGDKIHYEIDANNSIPYYPGNMMLVKNVTNDKGENETVVERVPREYMTFVASPEEIANKTILERMWRNVHLNFQLDRAYVGETVYPTWIYPIKDTLTLMPFVPDSVSISDALNMTKPGKLFKRIFWPVAA
jgi:hypothetical protein